MSVKKEIFKNTILFKNMQDKNIKKSKKEKLNYEEGNIIKPMALRLDNNKIKINLIQYDPKVNYYIKYWETICDNEYLIAQIKECMSEINDMKIHIKKLSK